MFTHCCSSRVTSSPQRQLLLCFSMIYVVIGTTHSCRYSCLQNFVSPSTPRPVKEEVEKMRKSFCLYAWIMFSVIIALLTVIDFMLHFFFLNATGRQQRRPFSSCPRQTLCISSAAKWGYLPFMQGCHRYCF